jgi:hypothetical protein
MARTQQRMFTTALVCVTFTACSTLPTNGANDATTDDQAVHTACLAGVQQMCTEGTYSETETNSKPDGPPAPKEPPRYDLPKCHGFNKCMDSFHQHHPVLEYAVEVAAIVVTVYAVTAAMRAFTHSTKARNNGTPGSTCDANCPTVNPVCFSYYSLPRYEQVTTIRPEGC